MSLWSKITGFASKDSGKSYDFSRYAVIDVEVGLQDHKIHDIVMPEQVVLQLTHKDVFLGFFKDKKKEVLSLRSGNYLKYDNTTFYNTATNNPVAKLSKNMQATISEWKEKGYDVKSASVRFVVAWKPKDAPKEEAETAVMLIDLLLTL